MTIILITSNALSPCQATRLQNLVNQQVYLNGKRLVEPYVVHDPASEDPFGDNFPPTDRYYLDVGLRPEWSGQIVKLRSTGRDCRSVGSRYFVMGDNRDRSWDSRYWGFVDREAIMGRPMLIYWSVDATADDYNDRSLFAALRGIGQALLHLPNRTRWHRMLREVH